MQILDDRFQAESGWNYCSILTLEAIIKNLHEICAECTVENS
jgi:hypothetical protein